MIFKWRRPDLRAVVRKINETCAGLRSNPSQTGLAHHPLLLRHRAPHAKDPSQAHEFRLGNELADLEFYLHLFRAPELEIRVVGRHAYDGFWLVTTSECACYYMEVDRRKSGKLASALLHECERQLPSRVRSAADHVC